MQAKKLLAAALTAIAVTQAAGQWYPAVADSNKQTDITYDIQSEAKSEGEPENINTNEDAVLAGGFITESLSNEEAILLPCNIHMHAYLPIAALEIDTGEDIEADFLNIETDDIAPILHEAADILVNTDLTTDDIALQESLQQVQSIIIVSKEELKEVSEEEMLVRQYLCNMAKKYIGHLTYAFIGGDSSLKAGKSDCSGFVWQIYKACGLMASYGKYRTCETVMEAAHSPKVPEYTEIPIDCAMPGDLIVIENSEKGRQLRPGVIYGHMGLYIGDGKMVHMTGKETSAQGCSESSIYYRGNPDAVHCVRVDLTKAMTELKAKGVDLNTLTVTPYDDNGATENIKTQDETSNEIIDAARTDDKLGPEDKTTKNKEKRTKNKSSNSKQDPDVQDENYLEPEKDKGPQLFAGKDINKKNMWR